MKQLGEFVPVYVTRPFGSRGITGQVSIRRGTLTAVKFVTLGNALGWGAYGLLELARKAMGA